MSERQTGSSKSTAQRIGLALGPLLFVLVLAFVDLEPGRPEVTRMAAVAALMATWWITDAIPLFATALVPLVAYPLLGIMAGRETAPVYVNNTIFLFLGGFMIALTMERWQLHRRIALAIIRLVGGGPSRLVLGFMIAAAVLSMWISNTATAIMMVPIALAIVIQIESRHGKPETHRFTLSLLLGIAYACSIGGMATLVGTPPNLAFSRIYEIGFPNAEPISFGAWMLMGLPISAAMLLVVWLLLTKVFCRSAATLSIDRAIVDREYAQLGPMSYEQRVTLAVFALTALLWVFREKLVLGVVTIPGWSQLLPNPSLIDDGTVAIAMASLLFLIPARDRSAKSPMIMGPEIATRLPWNIVLLFGGGFALAAGFQQSGLSEVLGQRFAGLEGLPPLAMIILVCLGLTFLTEVTSNTATTQMILPILGALAVDMQVNPLLLMIPATLAASCAFMMPVATPPNAVVFSSGRVRIAEMARIGFVINLIGVVLIALLFYFFGTAILGVAGGLSG